ncbi:MAG: hypothetical protein ACPG4K_06045 [Haloferula sp.]
MKPYATILPLLMLLSSCAPKAIVLGMPTKSRRSSGGSSSGGESNYVASPTPESLPRTGGIGLLDPKGLTNLPEERDMRPTGGNRDSGPVIANPPKED